MCQDLETSNWWKLIPDATGSYVKGTWTELKPMPNGYAPLWYGSQVLRDGKVFIFGGEYNGPTSGEVWAKIGALYDPVANSWQMITPPDNGSGDWDIIGDTQTVELPDGRVLMADIQGSRMAAFNENTLNFTDVSESGHTDRFDEEGWCLLPDGSILTVDSINAPAAERYIPSGDLTGQWISAGSTPQSLQDPDTQEVGPMVLRRNGTVFAAGATGHTAVYTPPTTLQGSGSWAAGPDLPAGLSIEDGSACLLPNDNVLVEASTNPYASSGIPVSLYEFDGSKLNLVQPFPNAPNDTSFQVIMLGLPTGQVMLTDFSNDVEIYTPSGVPNPAWKPKLSTYDSILIPGTNNHVITGTQLNGLSQGYGYGDDVQNATNFPIVRITMLASGRVYYCRTHDPSTMAVATGSKIVSAKFDVPANIEKGSANLQVVANGIASDPVPVSTVDTIDVNAVKMLEGTSSFGTAAYAQQLDNLYFGVNSQLEGRTGQVASMECDFTIPVGAGTLNSIDINSVVNAPLGVTVNYYVFDWSTDQYVQVYQQPSTGKDSAATIPVSQTQVHQLMNSSRMIKTVVRGVLAPRVNFAPNQFALRANQLYVAGG